MAGGRPRKYTAQQFEEDANTYFDSISSYEPLMDAENRTVLNKNGLPIFRVVYMVPPTISGLCLALGIDRSTWQNYADKDKNPAHAKVCERIRLKIEAYLEEQLLTRERSVQGIIFNLSNNFGWAERHEHSQRVELGEETRKVVAQNLTLDEKFALIREAAAEITQEQDGGNGDEESE